MSGAGTDRSSQRSAPSSARGTSGITHIIVDRVDDERNHHTDDPFRSLRRADTESERLPSLTHTPRNGPTISGGTSGRNTGREQHHSHQHHQHHSHHQPTSPYDDDYDGPPPPQHDDNSVEGKFEKLREQVQKRIQQRSWWLYVSFIGHFIVSLWCLWLLMYVETSESCSKPLRGLTTGLTILIITSCLSTLLTQLHVTVVFRRFCSTTSAVIREEADDEDEARIHERTGLTHQQTEMIVSRSITDRMILGCCSMCVLMMGTIILFVLLIFLFLYTVVSPSADCTARMPSYIKNGSFLCLGVFILLVIHLFVYIKMSRDVILCYEIHFCEQNLIKEEVKIRE